MMFSFESTNIRTLEIYACMFIVLQTFLQSFKIWYRLFSQFISIYFSKKKYDWNLIKRKNIRPNPRRKYWEGGLGNNFVHNPYPPPPQEKSETVSLRSSFIHILFLNQIKAISDINKFFVRKQHRFSLLILQINLLVFIVQNIFLQKKKHSALGNLYLVRGSKTFRFVRCAHGQ